jgi:hypothetical protein
VKYEKPLLYLSATALVLYVFRERKLNTKKLAELEQQYKQAEANTSSESNYAVMNNILLQEIETRVVYLSGLRGQNFSFGLSVGATMEIYERAHHSEYNNLLRFLSDRNHMKNPPPKQSGFNEILLIMNNKLKEMTIPEESLGRLWKESTENYYSNWPELRMKEFIGIVNGNDYTFDKSPILKSMMRHPMSHYIATGEANMYDALRQAYYREGTNNIWKTKFGY